MLFLRFCSLAILAQFLLFATPALAQDHRHAQMYPNPPALSWSELGALWGGSSSSPPPWLKELPQFEGPFPLPRARPENAPMPEEKRFSYWGYRHHELHERHVIAELIERTKGKNCCSGIQSGECRISKVDLQHRLAFIDGQWCPMDPDTRTTPLDSLADIQDGEEEIAVVCASRTYGGTPCSGTRTYCIGVKPPKV